MIVRDLNSEEERFFSSTIREKIGETQHTLIMAKLHGIEIIQDVESENN